MFSCFVFFFLSKTYNKNQRMSGYQFFAVKYLAELVVEKKNTVLLQSFPARLIGSENESRIWSNTG